MLTNRLFVSRCVALSAVSLISYNSTLSSANKLPASTAPASFPADSNSLGYDPLVHLPSVENSSLIPKLPRYSAVEPIYPIFVTHTYPVELCINEFLTKYPNPQYCPEIIDCKLIEEQIDPVTGVIYRKRLLLIHNTAPWIFRKLLKADTVEFIEESLHDKKRQVFELASSNKTFSSILSGTEYSKFAPHPDNPQHTLFVQTGGVKASAYFGPLKHRIEVYVSPRMRTEGYRAAQLLDNNLKQKYGPH
jgi:hypothetical protein